MNKIEKLKKELDEMVMSDVSYEELVKKSKELDRYITREMKKMHKNIVKVIKVWNRVLAMFNRYSIFAF